MQQIISIQDRHCNNYFRRSPVNTPNPALQASMQSDSLARLLNIQIANNIESYCRSFSEAEKEFLKYLNYYFKKWSGNIQIPIRNLCERFKCKERWAHRILARLRDAGWLITTVGGYGRHVTKRTLTERGKLVVTALVEGFGRIKQLIPKKSADYCADYSGSHSIYISSKADISQETTALQAKENPEMSQEQKDLCVSGWRKALNIVQNE